jgi:diadenosine tetraphosphatase ApaH/serine/threonine PP2A family protein phosphatase
MTTRSPTSAHPEPFSAARFFAMIQFHSAFRECLESVPLTMKECTLQRVREYLERLLAAPWPHGIPNGVGAPEGWETVAKVLETADTPHHRMQRHDELVCFVSEALCEAEDDSVLTLASTLTNNPSLLPEDMMSPSSPNSRRRFLRRRSKDSDNTDAPEETESLVRDTVDDIYRQLLESDNLPSEGDICFLLEHAMQLFAQEPNVVLVPIPAVLVGDVHGQIQDLKERILASGGPLGNTAYLFLGDYVDRGDASLHCIALLAAAKILFPDKVFLIRGNHESRNTNGCYGFLNECHQKFPRQDSDDDDDGPNKTRTSPQRRVGDGLLAFGLGPHPLWDLSNKMFDQLPIAAVVGEAIFCVHGGLSPRANHLAQIVACRRHRDVSTGGILADLTWSDPCTGMEGFSPNHRGCGQLFGEDATRDFLESSGLTMICRAHQCVRSGYLWTHNNQLVTVFSAPNYCGQGNDGAIMMVDAQGAPTFVTFRSALSWDDNDLDEIDEDNGSGEAEAETNGTMLSPTSCHVTMVAPPPKNIPIIFQSPPMQGDAFIEDVTEAESTDVPPSEHVEV